MEPTFILIGLAGAALGGAAGALLATRRERRAVGGARRRGEEILRQAEEQAARRSQEAELRQRDEAARRREAADQETEERRRDLREEGKRVERRAQGLDDRLDLLTRKERTLEDRDRSLQSREGGIRAREEELARVLAKETERLEQIAGLHREEATSLLLERLEAENERVIAERLERAQTRLKEEETRLAQRVLSIAIQRMSVSHAQETTVYAVEIPNDDMKGRLIGREGRNVRAFERETGVDLIVDDTPGVVVISSFDPVRREVARRALEKLIADGRVHPSRVEEVVAETRSEVEAGIEETGRRTLHDLEIHGLHPKLLHLLGRLKFRTSYGQNVLLHSVECAYLCGGMAAELGLDPNVAKRCGLLHDIGKAVSHEIEGGHAGIGADFARRHGENRLVVNAIAAHHEEVPYESPYAVLTQVGDAISASRPGARRDSLERYLKRMQALEEVAGSFPGVEQVYAVQAGREVRVLVNSGRVDDAAAVRVARDIAKRVSEELEFPGEIKVTVLRETKVVEIAR
ncbi:MAG TPA: ribonuclease Y [Planctomycetota bacterium]|nr:ribonuclease Y [Planctomycetota bacterium]